MCHKLSKKGRNPGAVDNWLEGLGYYRKNVAYDETCLFRAISEQLFDIQIYHERVRMECIEYARKNVSEFLKLMETKENLIQHLEKLEQHMVICGNIEIQMVSKAYKCNITIFDASQQQANYIIEEGNSKTLMLCLMNEDHYDAVYEREHIWTAGFCQALTYKILYEKLFKICNVDGIVHGMLYEKTYITTQAEMLMENKNDGYVDSDCEDISGDPKEHTPGSSINIAPFPFKVAKALDPSIYRNIEYDSWTEVRREMRLGEWYYGDDNLILGTRCMLNDECSNETYDCYIQDILKNENKCVVYITKLAQKRLVNYTDLSPENNAKPWPLPYRFSRSLSITTPPTTILSVDKIKSHRRKKDKNNSRSESSTNSTNAATHEGLEHNNVTDFVGAPLQIQINQNTQETTSDVANDSNSEAPSSENQNSISPGYQWEQPYYSYPMTPVLPDSFSWPSTPVSPGVFNFNVRPVITPVASTPNVMHYCDVNQSPIYNYPMEQYHYSYQPWAEIQQPAISPHPQATYDYNHNTKEPINMQKTFQINDANTQYVSYPESVPENMPLEQPMVCSPVPRVNPQIGIYSPVVVPPVVPPCTPVIYNRPADIIVPTAQVHMYPPLTEVPYIVQDQYTYPTTPNTAWYPVGVNAQGFIFPTPGVQTLQQQQ